MADNAAAAPADQTPLDLATAKYGREFVDALVAKFRKAYKVSPVMKYFLGRREVSLAAPGCAAKAEETEEDLLQLLCKMVLFAPEEWYEILSGGLQLPSDVKNDYKCIGVAFDASSRIRRAGIELYHTGLYLADLKKAGEDRHNPRCIYARWGATQQPEVFGIDAVPERPAGHVRVVAVSDTHLLQMHMELPWGDVLVHGGDLSYEESRSRDAEEFQKYLKAGNEVRGRGFQQFFGWRQAHGPLRWLHLQEGFQAKLVVGGNHDYILSEIGHEAVEELMEHYGLTYLHDQREPVKACGLTFWGSAVSFQAGLSAERAAVSGNIAFQVAEGEVGVKKVDELRSKLRGERVDVMVTHTPPAGCLLGKDGEGARALRALIEEEVRPKLFVCGHSHHPGNKLKDTWAKLGEGTLGVNASCMGVWNHLHGYPVVVDVPIPQVH